MSNRLFSEQEKARLQRKARFIYEHTRGTPLERLEWRTQPRRTWGRTLVNLLVLIALVALSCWLWGCVHGATVPMLRTEMRAGVPALPLAMAPASQGMVMGALMSLSAMGIVLAVRKVAQYDREAQGRHLASAAPCDDPLALPTVGMSREDLARIVAAMIAEATEARGLIQSEMDGLGVETWEERLTRAHRCIHGVVLCLGNLADRITVPVVQPEPVTVEIRMDTSDFCESVKQIRDATGRFAFKVIVRRHMLRVYESQAAGYRPAHGGHAS